MISTVAFALFIVGGSCGLVRLLIGPGLADRILALDVMLVALMGGVAVDAARRDDPTNLVLLVVVAVVGFATTVAASRFLEHEGSEAHVTGRPPEERS